MKTKMIKGCVGIMAILLLTINYILYNNNIIVY